jgi:hypothetical protein
MSRNIRKYLYPATQAFDTIRSSAAVRVEIVPNLEEGRHIMAQHLREQAHLCEK